MWTLFLIGLGSAVAVFAVGWAICVGVKNYGFLDVLWSYGILILAPFYAVLGTGYPLRRWLFALVGAAWSLRLGTYIFRRVLRHHPEEDVRYQAMRVRWPGPGWFFLFFELQALIIGLFSLPFLLAAFNPVAALSPVELAGLSLVVIAVAGEALADRQMTVFKADPANRGRVCEAGLWRFSRHPNYFFESLVWWGFFLAALGSPYGWTTVVIPLLMLYFLFQVTGIPLTEEYALKSKGEAYREYQRTTSAFVPWFRKAP
jgi:steroid 5-alpha reductase family enzyme